MEPPEPDAGLIARALTGNDAAFAALMARHKGWVFRFIRSYVGGAGDDAWDVLQDTFFAAWLALARFDTALSFEAWLRRIALNKCRDRARRNVVRRFLVGMPAGEDEEPLDAPDTAPGIEQQLQSQQDLQRLQQQLAQLPRSLKEPLLLTTLEGLSHREAGALLGINAKAVEMRVYRARERLKSL